MNAPVVYYHKVDYPDAHTLVRGGFTPPPRFFRQMKYLKTRGYVFHTATELIRHYREHGQFPRNGIAITFDDGWHDNFTNAFPVLKHFGVKATVFIIPSCIGQSSSKAVAHGEPPRKHLSREEILEMSHYGIEFGSHTMNHRLMPELSLDEITFEVAQAKSQIENMVQQPCLTFAYPAGFFTPQAQNVVKHTGHIAAFTTIYGPSDPLDLYALNRTEILRRDMFLFQFSSKIRKLINNSP